MTPSDARPEKKRIAVIPGDRIGREVIPEAVKVLKAAAASGGRDKKIEV